MPANLCNRTLGARWALRIGGIAFDAKSALPLHDVPDPVYANFLTGEPEAGDARVSVELAQGDAAPPAGARLAFDTGSAWAAYALENGDRAIVMARPAARETPLVSARFDRAVERVHIVCSERLAVAERFYDPLRYPLDQLLTMYRLAPEAGAIVHCALVDVGGRAVACPGVSGAGKTTLARQLTGVPGWRVLSDDRAVIRPAGNGYVVYGTPWPGEGGFAVNRGLPLAGIGFIEQRGRPATVPVTRSQAIHRLVRVASVPWYDRDDGPRVFEGLADLCGRVPAWLLRVPADPAAADAVLALAEGRTLQAG
jgi:hypothetical protein